MNFFSRTNIRIDHLAFSLLVALLPSQLGYHTWPDAAFVLGRRIDYLSPTLFVTDIVFLFVMVSFLIFKIIHRDVRPFRYPSGYGRMILIAIVISCAFIGTNISVSPIPLITAIAWLRVFQGIGIVWYMASSNISMHMIVVPLTIALLYSSFLGIIQWFVQSSIGGIFWWLGERTFDLHTPGIAKLSFCLPSPITDIRSMSVSSSVCPYLMRPYATFPHPNVLGGFLATTLPLMWYARRFPTLEHMYIRMGTLVTMCTGVAALFLTFSRSAWVVFILLMLFIFGGRIRRLPIFVQIVPVAVSLVIGLFVVSTFSTKTESVDMRVSLATAAVRQFQSSPIVGVGLGTFTYHLPSMTTLRSMTFLQPVHSIYMLHVSETGIIGVLVFILWMIFLGNMYIDFRDKKKLHDAKPWMLACIAVLLLGMIDHYPTTLQQGRLLFALLVGCLFLAHDGRVHS